MNSNFEFQYPWVLALLALLPVYAFLRGRVGKHSALTFSSADIARAAGAKAKAAAGRLLMFLRLLVVGLLIVALAGPRFANDRTETQASGVDIMLVLDLSWSMMALDMSGPGERVTRYDIASSVLEDFIRKRESDRIGLVVFSAVPYLASPLTLNHWRKICDAFTSGCYENLALRSGMRRRPLRSVSSPRRIPRAASLSCSRMAIIIKGR
jgi:Ca-activated chloride channel homolog